MPIRKQFWGILIWAPVLAAQVVPGRYIVELTGEPVATYVAARRKGGQPLATAAVQSRRASVRAEQARVRPQLERLGAHVVGAVDTVANALVVEISDAAAAQLSSVPGVAHVYPVMLARANLDHALPLHKIPDAWAAIGGQGNAGAGVKIGIIDSGIDVNHPGFQGSSLQVPPGFPLVSSNSDTQYTNNKIIVVRNYVSGSTGQDNLGHGTMVAMEAAGVTNTGPLATITGVAPGAWLGSYKVNDGLTFSGDGLLLALNDAATDGMDVINLSSGIPIAPRLGGDILAAAVERAASMGIVVSVSAGNQGPDMNTITSPATAPSAIAVGASVNDRWFAASVLANGTPKYAAIPGSGPNPSDPITAQVADVSTLDPSGQACGPLTSGGLAGQVALILRGNCTFEMKLNNAQAAGAVAAVIYDNVVEPNLVLMSVGAATLPAVFISNADGLDLKGSLQSNPPTLGLQFTLTAAFPFNPNQMASFSSRGPNVDAAIKPDVVAVGVSIYSATEKTNTQSEMYDPSGYLDADGTSFSAPLVTGSAALLKAARPGLTAAQYRSLLVNSATPMPAQGNGKGIPVQTIGAGVLNVSAALQNMVAASPVSLSFGTGSGTVDQSLDLTLTNLGTAADTFTITVAPRDDGAPVPTLSSSTVQVGAGGSQKVTARFTGSSLAAGQYQGYLHIQGTQSAVDTIVPYWYAVPDLVPADIGLLQIPDSGAARSQQQIYFRVVDQTGYPLPNSKPTVTATSGGGRVIGVVSQDNSSPGAFVATVQMGAAAPGSVFTITAGTVTLDVGIPLQ